MTHNICDKDYNFEMQADLECHIFVITHKKIR